MKTKILTAGAEDIALAGRIIKEGGLVAFPTETVYGLGANALDENAVKKIYAAKGRPCDNPLIVHISKKEDFAPLVKEVTPSAEKLIDAFFPAPLTIILEKSEIINDTVSGGLNTVAVRMPTNEIARAVIDAAGCPVAAPSANTSGLPSPTKAKYVIDDMNGKIDAIIDGGDCEYGVESTVITLAYDVPTILRPGAVTKEMLEAVIGYVEVARAVTEGMAESEEAQSPGMKYKHYSPRAKLVIVNGTKKQYEEFVNSRQNAFALCFEEDEVNCKKVCYGRETDDLSQARELFDALRKLDEAGAEKVYARMPHKTGVGMAVYNRLIRAAAFEIIDLTKPFTIGLTGQTGAGKGYVCERLRELGFTVLDSDLYVKKLYEKGGEILEKLTAQFGESVVKNGAVDRRELARLAFADRESADRLNRIVHPLVIAACEADAKGLTVLDAPQLFEAKADKKCYKIISVLAPEKLRLERIMKRDGISEEQAGERMNAQLDEDFFKAHSDFVIVNDGRDINEQINSILEAIL